MNNDALRTTIIGDITVVMYVDKITLKKGDAIIPIDDSAVLDGLLQSLAGGQNGYIVSHTWAGLNAIASPYGADRYEVVSVLADMGRRVFCRPDPERRTESVVKQRVNTTDFNGFSVAANDLRNHPVDIGEEITADRVRRLQAEWLAALPTTDMTDLSLLLDRVGFTSMMEFLNSRHDSRLRRMFMKPEPILCDTSGEVYYPLCTSLSARPVAYAVKIGDDLFRVYE